MLVLTRKLDEAIQIGDDIKITILRVKGNTVRIGIEAPREVRVVRDELDRDEAQSAAGHAAASPAVVSAASPAVVSAAESAANSARSGEVTVARMEQFELVGSESRLVCEADEHDAVVTTIVDSPEPSSSRLFVGKVRVNTTKNRISEHEQRDQAAPLRAFLRTGTKLQIAG